MVQKTETDWGTSCETFHGLMTVEEKRIYSKGINEIKPYGLIPLHQHKNDAEDYQILSAGLHVIVVPASEMKRYSLCLQNMIMYKGKTQQGDTITCPKGYAHALYNNSNETGLFAFCKYYPK